jgi:hypothetical protein
MCADTAGRVASAYLDDAGAGLALLVRGHADAQRAVDDGQAGDAGDVVGLGVVMDRGRRCRQRRRARRRRDRQRRGICGRGGCWCSMSWCLAESSERALTGGAPAAAHVTERADGDPHALVLVLERAVCMGGVGSGGHRVAAEKQGERDIGQGQLYLPRLSPQRFTCAPPPASRVFSATLPRSASSSAPTRLVFSRQARSMLPCADVPLISSIVLSGPEREKEALIAFGF